MQNKISVRHLKQHFHLGMIPKIHSSIVVSHVKAPMIKILLLILLHMVAFVWWGSSLISLRDNLDNMPPHYQGINHIFHGILVKHPFPFVPSGKRILNLIFQLALVKKISTD
jgi:hypothetical protein